MGSGRVTRCPPWGEAVPEGLKGGLYHAGMPRRRRVVDFAREQRRDPTEAERTLWHYIRRRQLRGYKFRRQHPIGPYIADFVCLVPRVALEIDGSQHLEEPERDRRRDAYLAEQGYRVLHFTNHEVLSDIDSVLEAIGNAVDSSEEKA